LIFFCDFFIFLVIFLIEGVRDFFEHFTPRTIIYVDMIV